MASLIISVAFSETSNIGSSCKNWIEAPRPCLPAGRHSAGLPGKVISFYIVPLDPAYKAGLAGHVPVKWIKPI
jgi:hypothetical protein